MSDFSQLKCEACRVGAPPASANELDDFLQTHSSWEKIDVNGEARITRVYAFDNFVDALASVSYTHLTLPTKA